MKLNPNPVLTNYAIHTDKGMVRIKAYSKKEAVKEYFKKHPNDERAFQTVYNNKAEVIV